MCLSGYGLKVLPKNLVKQIPDSLVMYGWKSYPCNKKGDKVLTYTGYKPIGKWLRAYNEEIRVSYNPSPSQEDSSYKSGFHIFLSKQDAVDYGVDDDKIFKVKFRKIRTIGRQNTVTGYLADCVIAYEMFIIPNKKRKTSKKRK